MVIFVGYHATSRHYRTSIQESGLLAHKPYMQREGVFVFSDELLTSTLPGLPRVRWAHRSTQDLWRVAYCGPMFADPFVENAVILPSVTDVTLVTGND